VVTIERKGSENLAKASATAVDQSNLGQPPKTKPPDQSLNEVCQEVRQTRRM